MQIELLIQAEVERTTGPFQSRDDLEQALIEEATSDPGTLSVGDAEYDVTMFEVNAQPVGKRPAKPKGGPQTVETWRKLRQSTTAAVEMGKTGDPALNVQLERLDRLVDGLYVQLINAGVLKMTE